MEAQSMTMTEALATLAALALPHTRPYTPLPWQAEFHHSATPLITADRGAGRTQAIAAHAAALTLMHPEQPGLILGRNYEELWCVATAMIDLGAVKRFRRAEMYAETPGGGGVRFMQFDRADRARGMRFMWLGVDGIDNITPRQLSAFLERVHPRDTAPSFAAREPVLEVPWTHIAARVADNVHLPARSGRVAGGR